MPKKKLYPDLSDELDASGLSNPADGNGVDSDGNETMSRRLRSRSRFTKSFETSATTINRSTSYESLSGHFTDHDESFDEWWSATWKNVNQQIEEYCSKIQNHVPLPYLFGSIIFSILLLITFNSSTPKPVDGHLYSVLGDRSRELIDKYPLSAPFYTMEVVRSFRQIVRHMTGVELEPLKQPLVVLIASRHVNRANELVGEFIKLNEKYIPQSTELFQVESGLKRSNFEEKLFGKVKKLEKEDRTALVGVLNIDELAETAPLVIHNIADNENPAFRNVIYLMTMKINEDPGASSSECVQIVTKTLADLWISPKLGEDQTYPIIARISALSVCLV
ncbi:unnamed protein product [Bursaphelenchus xylophilus]|uniref:(pine wood nematode) hypothetical protein n=1 Tax=Bursaphelenchus xylophilus TaxID=6326 RepID=A0A1I7S9R0_BURXY|nr:unnamed protein product [Bursaphelenchus xylophilus]CAG9129180.1 unnamed protein product [Bursaphelenchus xylophilus]